MSRHTQRLWVAALLFALAIASCYFGPRYELHKFPDNAQEMLNETGENFFIGLKWIALGLLLFLLGVILTIIGGKGWIESRLIDGSVIPTRIEQSLAADGARSAASTKS